MLLNLSFQSCSIKIRVFGDNLDKEKRLSLPFVPLKVTFKQNGWKNGNAITGVEYVNIVIISNYFCSNVNFYIAIFDFILHFIG